MVAFPDTRPTRDKARESQARIGVPAKHSSMRRAILMCAAAALMMSSVGIWVMPSEDAAMQLIKLLISVAMVGAALLLINALNERRALPEVRFDSGNRQLQVYEYDCYGRATLSQSHDIDDLSELIVEEKTLRARDAGGMLLLTLPVAGKDVSAIRKAITNKF